MENAFFRKFRNHNGKLPAGPVFAGPSSALPLEAILKGRAKYFSRNAFSIRERSVLENMFVYR